MAPHTFTFIMLTDYLMERGHEGIRGMLLKLLVSSLYRNNLSETTQNQPQRRLKLYLAPP